MGRVPDVSAARPSGAGGQFLKGSGESQLESDRRLYRKQISRIEAELEQALPETLPRHFLDALAAARLRARSPAPPPGPRRRRGA